MAGVYRRRWQSRLVRRVVLGRTLGTDNLSAEDVESASEVTSPAITQLHALTANDVESNSEVSSPSVTQLHALTADDVESNSEVTAPAIVNVLSAEDVESASEVTSPAITQVHALLGEDVESRSQVSVPVLSGEGVTDIVTPDTGAGAGKYKPESWTVVERPVFERETRKVYEVVDDVPSVEEVPLEPEARAVIEREPDLRARIEAAEERILSAMEAFEEAQATAKRRRKVNAVRAARDEAERQLEEYRRQAEIIERLYEEALLRDEEEALILLLAS